MTGTGSQGDPLIPETLTEFIEAVGTSGAYVALDRDINAVDDPEYSGELTSGISWNAAQTDGRNFVLTGITVRNSSAAIALRRGVTVQNLAIRDFGHAKEAATVTIGFSGSGQNATMRGCLISANVSSGAYNHFLAEELIMEDCAFDANFSETSANSWNTFLKNVTATRCTIRAHGSFKLNAGSTYMMEHGNYARTALIFDGAEVANSGTVLAATTSCKFSGSYMALINSKNSETDIVRTYSTTSVSSVIASDGSIGIQADTGFTAGTPENLKDKDWLTSVGFLP